MAKLRTREWIEIAIAKLERNYDCRRLAALRAELAALDPAPVEDPEFLEFLSQVLNSALRNVTDSADGRLCAADIRYALGEIAKALAELAKLHSETGFHARTVNLTWWDAIYVAFPSILAKIRDLEDMVAGFEDERNGVEDQRDAALYFMEIHDIRNSDELAARDARMKREGAAEWIEKQVQMNSGKTVLTDVEANGIYLTFEELRCEAVRLRKESGE